ncbi:phosphatase PAP2 family protein [Bacteroidota bacterium]
MRIYGLKDIKSSLLSADIYHLIILLFYTTCAVIFINQVEKPIYILVNIIISVFIVSTAVAALRMPDKRKFILFRRLLMAPLVYLIYSQAQNYIKVINPNDLDYILINWDRFIFGTDPTVVLDKISFPALTEYLQISYMTYFLMPIIHGVELHFKRDDKRFNDFAGIVIFSFYISYILYFIMPAIGPRFTLHDFGLTSLEMPGLWLTETLRDIVNQGGGIIAGAVNPAAVVNRDCMPSGHTMMTVVNIIMAFRLKSKFKWLFLIFGTSLIFATVYLRYHYVVDLIAGIILAFLTIWLEPKISVKLRKLRHCK